MNYTMTKPCPHCPFRTDVPGYLRGERAEEIADALARSTFACHETTVATEDDDGECNREETRDSQHCAGALIMLEKMEQPSQMMRICERIGMYDRCKLDMDSPVFDDASEFIAHHEESEQLRAAWRAGSAKRKKISKSREVRRGSH